MSGEGRPLGDGDPDEIICACRGITRGQIQEGIARQECRNLADLAWVELVLVLVRQDMLKWVIKDLIL